MEHIILSDGEWKIMKLLWSDPRHLLQNRVTESNLCFVACGCPSYARAAEKMLSFQ